MAKKSLRGALQRHEARKTLDERQKKREAHEKQMEAARKPKPSQTGPKPAWLPFQDSNLVISLGDADFSFTVAALEENHVSQTIATNLDTFDLLTAKYANTARNAEYLHTDARVDAVLYGVDATALHKCKPLVAAVDSWTKENPGGGIDFVFNFPHIGASIKDVARNVRAHQQLVEAFFRQAARFSGARVIITLFDGEPYDSWQVRALARTAGFKLERSGRFDWAKFPGYSHCLTAKEGRTSKVQKHRPARIYLFTRALASEPA